MKKLFIFSLMALLAFACGKADKKQQLDKLKKQQQEIVSQIEKLEAELSTDGSNTVSKDSKPVEITTVSISNFDHFIEIQGTVKADDEVIVPSEAAGTILHIFIKEGDAVKKGQVLAELDSEIQKKSLDEIKTSYEMANTVYERQKRLWDQQVGSEIQFLQAKSNKEALENRMATLQEQIDKTKIKSPINGSVESLPVKVGQMASPGSPVARVVNFSRVKVEAELAESYSSKVKVGNPVIVHFPDDNQDIDSRISFTSKYINPINRTFTIEVPLTTGNVEYKVNMVAVVKINDYKNPQSISVPVNIIQNSRNGKYVFLAKKSGNGYIAAKQAIEIGQIYNGMAEITSGLAAGDKIISQGYQTVNDGQFVTFSE